MARLSIEECWFSDSRRDYLRERIGFEADSAALALWRNAQTYWSNDRSLIPKRVFDRLRHAELLIAADLAEVRGDEVYARGSADHLEWAASIREKRSAAGRASADARREKFGTSVPQNATNLEVLPEQNPNTRRTQSNKTEHSGSGSGFKNSTSSKTNTLKSRIAAREIEFHVYRHYPRKVGKSDGLAAAQRVLTSPDEMLAMEQAAINFRAEMQREARPADKIPYFSTWVRGQWRDWVNPEVSEDFAKDQPKAAGGGDPVMAEAAKVGAAVRLHGDSASSQAELKAELGEDLYAVVCRSNMSRLRGLKNDDWYLRNVANALRETRERMAARASPPADVDPITNREASRVLANLGVK